MPSQFAIDEVGRFPAPGDNVAIAIRRLESGTEIALAHQTIKLSYTVLEGHRFACAPIAAGQALLSWGLPFGVAVRDLAPGDYLCNDRILAALKQRHVDFALPELANFTERVVRYQLDEAAFKPGCQVTRHPEPRCFEGYARTGGRGVGTRNFIAVLGTTSLTASYARTLAARFKDAPERFPDIDGVVPVTHTEGGGRSRPHNLEFILRTLAGFMVNPNLGAVLALDFGTEVVTNAMVHGYMAEHGYRLDGLLHRFLSLRGNFQAAMAEGEAMVKSWLEPVAACRRTPQSLDQLRIGLQCGGSDAFSGVSGNPLVGWMSKELVRYGGSANLAETDELIGAEQYVLSNVRDLETARAFLERIERFQQRVGWHGHTAEENPSGGNNFRGLYNIALKSIGAARKKDPAVRLDYVIDYGQLMPAPGFYFMDSPGNDLESVAGQVAAGCNLILFTTGNGSITNFPFVPTIKIMTNTGRYQMLTREMDINAGRYLDGTPMEELGRESFEGMVRVASGERSAGEHAGHAQVQIWREWRLNETSRIEPILNAPRPSGEPLKLKESGGGTSGRSPNPSLRFKAFQNQQAFSSDQVGLIVPTSLCSGQIARLIADRLNHAARASGIPSIGVSSPDDSAAPDGPGGPAIRNGITRYVALAHTEGCGVSSGESERMYLRTMVGYLGHPMVRRALLLEHGCERTHNDAMRNFMEEHGVDRRRYGWASVQLDGGIEKVTAKVVHWFANSEAEAKPADVKEAGLEHLRLGLTAVGPLPDSMAKACAHLARIVVASGGTVVIPHNATLLASAVFVSALVGDTDAPLGNVRPSLAYGQPAQATGLHVMETPTDHLVETLTGLGATGVEVMLAHVAGQPLQSHPMIPLIQVAAANGSPTNARQAEDLDLLLEVEKQAPADSAGVMLELVLRVASREYAPKLFALGNTDFQMTRGWLGVSM